MICIKKKTNKDFLVTQEQKLGTRGHRARLKHTLGASAVLSLISNVKYFFVLQFMEENGNIKGNATWAKNVPVFYRRPTPTDPQ